LRRAVVLLSSAALTAGLTALPAVQAQAKPTVERSSQDQGDAAGTQVNVLVFHGPAAKQDDPVKKATAAIENLGEKNGFKVVESEDARVFNPADLAKYRGVVFLSADGVTLDADQEAAFQSYINNGGGFVGVHDAARAQSDSSWFTGLIGTRPALGLPDAEKVVESAVNAENPPNETKGKLFDGKDDTKWSITP
jgi:hypothetical protein